MIGLLRVGSVARISALVLLVSACGATTVIDTTTTIRSTAATTSTLPSGSVAELLDRLRAEVLTLSTAIVDGQGAKRFAEIDGIWRAAAAQLQRTSFRESTQYQIDLMRNAVERKRPADADKASLQIRALVDNEYPDLAD